MTDLVPVVDVPCPHGGEHPDGHLVALRPKIGLVGATVATERLREAFPDIALIKGALVETYVRYGVAEVDGEPVTLDDIEAILADEAAGRIVAEKADDLYSESVTAPLVNAVSKFSEAISTDASTSAPTDSSDTPPKRSKRSSTTTSPMVDTERNGTPLAGDSSSSPKPDPAD
jgi:hypothetical protein